MATHVVDSAKAAPGKCILTGTTDGPFLDTGKRLPRYGRVYISIRGLRDALNEVGFLSPEQADSLREDNDRLQEENRRLTGIEDDYNTLVDTVRPHIEVEPEIVERETVRHRQPTDDEIEDWVARKGAGHPAVESAKRVPKGSPEEWRELYGDIPPGHPQFTRAPTAGGESTLAQELASKDAGNVVEVGKTTNIVTIHDQEIDLNEVLDQNVNDVLAWSDGHDDAVHERLVDAEYKRARDKGSTPRKGVVEGLGFEYVDPEDYDYDAVDVEGPEDVRDETTTSITEEREQEVATNVKVSEPETVEEDTAEENEFIDTETEDEEE